MALLITLLALTGCGEDLFEPPEPLLQQTHEVVGAEFIFDAEGNPDRMVLEVIDPERSPDDGVVSGYVIEIRPDISGNILDFPAFVRGEPTELTDRGISGGSITGLIRYTIQANSDQGENFILRNNRRQVDAIELQTPQPITIATNLENTSQAIFNTETRFAFDDWTAAEYGVRDVSGGIEVE